MPVLIWVSNITSIWISSSEMLESFNSIGISLWAHPN
jgi:hypothetical protein